MAGCVTATNYTILLHPLALCTRIHRVVGHGATHIHIWACLEKLDDVEPDFTGITTLRCKSNGSYLALVLDAGRPGSKLGRFRLKRLDGENVN